jgi:hypothetical protein
MEKWSQEDIRLYIEAAEARIAELESQRNILRAAIEAYTSTGCSCMVCKDLRAAIARCVEASHD